MRRNAGYGRSVIDLVLRPRETGILCMWCGGPLVKDQGPISIEDPKCGYIGNFDSVACLNAHLFSTYPTRYFELLLLVHKRYPTAALTRAPPRSRLITFGGDVHINDRPCEEYRYPVKPVTMLYVEKKADDVLSLTHTMAPDTSMSTTSTDTSTSTATSRKRKNVSLNVWSEHKDIPTDILRQMSLRQMSSIQRKTIVL